MLGFTPLDSDKLFKGYFFMRMNLKVKRYQMIVVNIAFLRLSPICQRFIPLWSKSLLVVKKMRNLWLLLPLCFSMAGGVFFRGPACPALVASCPVPGEFFQLDYYVARLELLKLKLPSYFVLSGETLYSIGRKYLVTPQALQAVNKIKKADKIVVGRRLYIPPATGNQRFLNRYHVQAGETREEILRRYRLRDWEFQRFNPQITGERLLAGTVIWLPRQSELTSRGSLRGIRLLKPVNGILTSPYGMRWGRMHWGMDLAARRGTPVKAAAAGEVLYAGWRGSYGLLVIVRHGNFSTYYGHLSQICVSEGDELLQGDLVGQVGSTGRAYGEHLHFEVEVLGKKINPAQFLF